MKPEEHLPLVSKGSSDDVATSPLLDAHSPSGDPSGGLDSLGQVIGPRIPAVGEIVGSKYRIEGIIGRGGMGIVLAARHVQLGERVALKVLLLGNFTNGDFQSRFLREAQVTARLRNEHIARVVDVAALGDGTPYMVMEYVDGVELREVLEREGKLPIALAVEYIVQACEGLAEAHASGIVHRDLKPPNFIVTKRTDGSVLLKILDFGISKLLSPEAPARDLTETGAVMGSPKYMSPEQFGTAADADTRSDVWALGAILYEMLAGEPAFNEPTIARVCARVTSGDPPPSLRASRPEIPEALENAVMASLALDREERTQNVAALAAEVLAAIDAPDAESRTAKIHAALGKPYPDASTARMTPSASRLAIEARARARLASRSGATPADAKPAARSWRGAVLVAVILALVGVIVVRELAARASRAPVVAAKADVPIATATIATPAAAAPAMIATAPEASASASAGIDALDASANAVTKRAPKPTSHRGSTPSAAASTASSASPAPAAPKASSAPANPYEGRL